MKFKKGDYVIVINIENPNICTDRSLSQYNPCIGCVGKVTKTTKGYPYMNVLHNVYTLNFLDKNIDKTQKNKFDESLWISKELRKATKKEICFEEL